MLEELGSAKKRVVGLKQVLRSIERDEINSVILADDVDAFLEQKVIRACELHKIALFRGYDMRQLGKVCGVEVKAAVAGWQK